MKEYIFSNGIKLVYKKSNSELTSICIAIDAGAMQDDNLLGIAHATEHMLYKGTYKRSESQINEDLSKIFGFQNAMTNYPYVIYYGTLLNEDFKDGLDLFSDIILNPSFPKEGFKEEMNVIIEELNEWDEELEQLCEDKLFINSFESSRLKYPIIGRYDDLKKITINDIKEFYKRKYFPENIKIAIVSSLDFCEVKNNIDIYFGSWNPESIKDSKSNFIEEKPKSGIYNYELANINTCKVQIIAPILGLDNDELNAFRIFNNFFGEGINSVLFDILRTQNGLVYDVMTRIAFEKCISIYKITFSTSKENINKAIELIKDCISNIETYEQILTQDKINQLIKSLKLKKLFREEQSIQLAKELATYELMFNDYKLYEEMTNNMDKFNAKFIIDVAKKVLSELSIQIISAK